MFTGDPRKLLPRTCVVVANRPKLPANLCRLLWPCGVIEGNVYRESVIEAGDSQHFREAAGSEQSNSIYLYEHTQKHLSQ